MESVRVKYRSYLSTLKHRDMSDLFKNLSLLTMNRLYHHLFMWIQTTKIKYRATMTNPHRSQAIKISEDDNELIESCEGIAEKRPN